MSRRRENLLCNINYFVRWFFHDLRTFYSNSVLEKTAVSANHTNENGLKVLRINRHKANDEQQSLVLQEFNYLFEGF